MIAAIRRLLAFASLLAVCACGQPAALDRLSAGERGKVVEVRSGHVVVLDSGLLVRLAGVEAPALSQPYGKAAKDRLAGLALNQDVQLFYGGARRDRFDRWRDTCTMSVQIARLMVVALRGRLFVPPVGRSEGRA